MIYLASPFWHSDKSVRDLREQVNCHVANRLLIAGHMVYAPIAYGRPIDAIGGVPVDRWTEHGLAMTRAADCVWVLPIRGWRESKGVKLERDLAAEIGIPCELLPDAAAYMPPLTPEQDAIAGLDRTPAGRAALQQGG